MKILLLADINSTHIQKWVKGLVDRGCTIKIFSYSLNETDWYDSIQNFSWHTFSKSAIPANEKSKWSKLMYAFAKKEAQDVIDHFNPNIVHAHYATSYGLLAHRLKFNKTIISLWGSDVFDFPKKSRVHKFLFRKIVSNAPVVCSTSNIMAKEARKYVDKEILITPFGVDTTKFCIGTQKHDRFTIGTVKLLEDIYGIDRLIRLYAEYNKRSNVDSFLRIYGSGSKLSELKRLAKDLHIEHLVKFEGWVNADQVVNAYHSLDVFVALSRKESYGVAAIEAQSTGIPVVVSNIGGLPEVVDESAGFIINGDDVEAGVESLLILENEENRSIMGKAGRMKVEQNFSDSICLDKLMQIYTELMLSQK